MTKPYIKTIVDNGKEYRALIDFKRSNRRFKTATAAIKYAAKWKARYVSLKLAAMSAPKVIEVEIEKLQTCEWVDDGEGNYTTGCEKIFTLIVDTPEENEMVYCPYCGKRIKTVECEVIDDRETVS